MLGEITVSVPPTIAHRELALDSLLVSRLESTMREIANLDRIHGVDLAALNTLLVRTESVASSKIEHIEANMDDYARALHGAKSNPSAVSMVAATAALDGLVRDAGRNGRLELEGVLSAHRALMRDDANEAGYGGRLRDMQNWIGGSDHSPRSAVYVPPPPDLVAPLIDDLLVFANRDDLPVMVQAAVVHAQFESIHPFTDGNGRIGRALINAVLRLRGATSQVVVPLASALVVRRDHYFELLDTYRSGDIGPLIEAFAGGARIAAAESLVTAQRLRQLPTEWAEMVGAPRQGSAAKALISLLPTHPILTADDACELIDASRSSVFAAVERLQAAGILRPLTNRRRDRVWGAGSILDELDDLGLRIGAATR